MTPLSVFIGYDSRQPIAYQVAAHSVWATAHSPLSITRLDIRQLPMTRRGLTEFTYTRFLAPYLSGWEGVSIFIDSDVLVRADMTELLAYPLMEPKTPVFVVKGRKKFEWASVMVFNNQLCQMLTPLYCSKPQLNPLSFAWAHTVGDLPAEWNHLVGYDVPLGEPKLVHFTQGIPVWPETKDCEYAAEWHRAMTESQSTCSFDQLMGHSVHLPHMKVGT